MRLYSVLFISFVFLTGCAIRQEVHKTTETIGDVSNELTQERTIDAPAGTVVQVSPASKAEDGQLRLKF